MLRVRRVNKRSLSFFLVKRFNVCEFSMAFWDTEVLLKCLLGAIVYDDIRRNGRNDLPSVSLLCLCVPLPLQDESSNCSA
jgi:hypothetical protein